MEFKLSQAIAIQKKYGLTVKTILKWERQNRIPDEFLQGENNDGTHFNLEEEQYLIDHYSTAPKAKLIGHLRRSWNSIYVKAHKMGLTREAYKPDPNMWLSEWNGDQFQYVKEWCHHLTEKEISDAIGKTIDQIYKLKKYLLERNEILWPLFAHPKKPWTEIEKLYLKESFRSKAMEIMCLTLRRYPSDVYTMAKSLKLKRATKRTLHKESLKSDAANLATA